MDSETLGRIVELAQQANGPTVISSERTGEPKYMYWLKQTDGSYTQEYVENPRKHIALDDSAVVEFAIRFASFPSCIWYSRNAIVAVLDDDNQDSSRRETCTLSLELSKPMKKLLELENSNAMFKQAEAVRLLRLWFHGCLVPAGDILLAIRNLRFIKNSATESNVNHGQRSISSALTSEVTGRNAIPESFFVEVPVFHNAFAYRESVEILVDIDDATETIRFVPAPGSIEAAIARAEERIGMHLQQEIASAMDVNYEKDADGVFVDDDGDPAIVPPVYYGKPE